MAREHGPTTDACPWCGYRGWYEHGYAGDVYCEYPTCQHAIRVRLADEFVESGTMKVANLNDLLPEAAITDLNHLFVATKNKPAIEQIKEITTKYREELFTKEVDADYLAWAILNALTIRGGR